MSSFSPQKTKHLFLQLHFKVRSTLGMNRTLSQTIGDGLQKTVMNVKERRNEKKYHLNANCKQTSLPVY